MSTRGLWLAWGVLAVVVCVWVAHTGQGETRHRGLSRTVVAFTSEEEGPAPALANRLLHRPGGGADATSHSDPLLQAEGWKVQFKGVYSLIQKYSSDGKWYVDKYQLSFTPAKSLGSTGTHSPSANGTYVSISTAAIVISGDNVIIEVTSPNGQALQLSRAPGHNQVHLVQRTSDSNTVRVDPDAMLKYEQSTPQLAWKHTYDLNTFVNTYELMTVSASGELGGRFTLPSRKGIRLDNFCVGYDFEAYENKLSE